MPTCCNWGRLRRLTCRKKNMEFRRAFPRRLQRGAVTSVCLDAPIGSRACRFDGARGGAPFVLVLRCCGTCPSLSGICRSREKCSMWASAGPDLQKPSGQF